MLPRIYGLTLLFGLPLLAIGLLFKKARPVAFLGLGLVAYTPYQIGWAIFADLCLKWVLMLTIWQIWPPSESTFSVLFLWPPVFASVLTPFVTAYIYYRYVRNRSGVIKNEENAPQA